MDYLSILSTIIVIALIIIVPMVLISVWLKSTKLRRRAEWLRSQSWQLLAIKVPKENDKSPLAAEQMFAALHGVLRSDPLIQEFFSFEIVATKESIHFYVFVPIHLRDFLEGQIYAQFPAVVIQEVADYSEELKNSPMPIAGTEMALTKAEFYPIKTFPNFEVDPLAGITSVLTKLDDQEKIIIQYCIKPVADTWQNRGEAFIRVVKAGRPRVSVSVFRFFGYFLFFLTQVFLQAINPKNTASGIDTSKPTSPELSGPMQEALKGIESKITKLGFETIIRVIAIGKDEVSAKTRVQSTIAAYKQYNTTNQNGFVAKEVVLNNQELISDFASRNIEKKGNIFNIEELASIFHFPNQTVETPGLAWSGPKKGEAPASLPLKSKIDPKELTLIGKTDFRNISHEFGIKVDDRRRHVYIIGKSGVGKSVLLENMILDDIYEDRGVIIVDPHGELADKIISSVPRRRMEDIVIFDPSDRRFPIAFNLLEDVGEDFKGMVASGFVGIFKKIFGYSWGPRLEHILRNTVLALLDVPNSTMLGIPKMLTEQKYRSEVLDYVRDPVIQDFWFNEFEMMDQKFKTEAVSPILNKVGQFLSTPTIRNIVGQPKSNIDIRHIMDEQKILIVNLSRGKIGEDNTALMGAMMITKVQLAAMSRADVAESARPDCFLYVDEFQNFATESFATILSEARKYHLSLTMANQYIAQMPEEVRDAVFGNVGTLISFRVGATDADFLVKELAPVFDENDLVNLEKYHIYAKLMIDGIAASAFSAQTLPPREFEENLFQEMVEYSRRMYSQSKEVVESQIEKWTGIKEKLEAQRAAKDAAKILENAAGKMQINRQQGLVNRVNQPSQHSTTLSPSTNKFESKLPETGSATTPPDEDRGGGGVKEQFGAEKPGVNIDAVNGVSTEESAKPQELKVIGEFIYKQQDQKGGRKWFIGEKVEDEYKKEVDRQTKRAEKRALKV